MLIRMQRKVTTGEGPSFFSGAEGMPKYTHTAFKNVDILGIDLILVDPSLGSHQADRRPKGSINQCIVGPPIALLNMVCHLDALG